MASVDGILSIMDHQEATSLHLVTGQNPQLLRGSEPLRFTMPPTSSNTLQAILGPLYRDHLDTLRADGRVEFEYQSGQYGMFQIALTHQNGDERVLGVDVRRIQGSELRHATETDIANAGANTNPESHPAKGSAITSRLGPTEAASSEPSPSGSASARQRRPTDLTDTRRRVPPNLASVLALAVEKGASDLHLTQGKTPSIRVDGQLRPLEATEAIDLMHLLTDDDLGQLSEGRSVDFGLELETVGRFRVNVYLCDHGLATAIRVLRKSAPSLSELRLPRQLERVLALPHGLVIVSGYTGSGKSTTLAALARGALERRPGVLVSLEDPIEYTISAPSPRSLVRQREVGTHVRSFADGLRDTLREDPDYLLIGEMRDPETIGHTLTAAETGHLVLTSLHTRTAASAADRIIDSYPAQQQRQVRIQLAESLRAVISQRLLPRRGGPGRIAAIEFLWINDAVSNMIREGKTAQIASALQSGRDDGMLPLERHLADLVNRRLIHPDDAIAAANDTHALQSYLK